MVTLILTQDSKLVPPTSIQISKEGAAEFIGSLTIKHIRAYEYPFSNIVSIEYDSLFIGATVTIKEETK